MHNRTNTIRRRLPGRPSIPNQFRRAIAAKHWLRARLEALGGFALTDVEQFRSSRRAPRLERRRWSGHA